jgi:hypothetical protein
MARPKPADDSDDAPLKRLGGGRWQTRDERFTIEPQSGTWAVVDAEQTDDFGMPLVRGPYPSLTDAKAAISSARTSDPAESPLTERIEQRRSRPPAEPKTPAKKSKVAEPARSAAAEPPAKAAATPKRAGAGRSERRETSELPAPAEPAEPSWLSDLEPSERGRARRLIARLEEEGIGDATSVVRRDLHGNVPAIAAIAVARRLAELGDDATPRAVVELLADGRDERLDVRWRIVDGAGRPIVLRRR